MSKIAQLVGPIDKAHAGKGTTFAMGATLSFSGTGAYYGQEGKRGVELASKHILANGGPKFTVDYKDIPLGESKGVNAMREFGANKIPVILTANVADIGSEFAGAKQYEILSIGGVTGLFGNGMPYFWGLQANLPNDPYPGMLKYVKAKMPDVKKVVFLGPDLGTGNKPVVADWKAKVQAAGLTPVTTIFYKLGSTSYATALQQLKAADADLVMLSAYGNDVGYFMKQYVTSGIKAQIIGSDLLAPSIKIGGSALENYTFSFDYFDANKAANDWAQIFIDEYKSSYGGDATSVAADYYDGMFLIWDLMRRVSAKSGNIRSGKELQDALQANPTFKSVHGGSGATVGTLALDPTTHSPSKRAMGLYRFANNTVTPLAYYDIGGADFKLA